MDRDTARKIALLLGAGRVAVGLALSLSPRVAGRGWVGEAVDSAGGRVAVQATGARDVILGAGLLLAMGSGRSTRRWVEAGIAADLADTVITIGAWRGLPPVGRFVTVATTIGAGGAGAAIASNVD